MIEFISEELSTASNLLSLAVGRYLTACEAIQNFYAQNTNITGVPRSLSDRVTNELLSATSYETSIKRAKSIISQATNCSPTVVPVHSLPSEVLTRIFHLAVGSRPCHINIRDNSGKSTSFPKYPDLLSHVCSRWRQLTLSLPELWTHIDIVHLHSLTPGYVSRAVAFRVRSGNLPLDIHIRIPVSYDTSNDSGMLGFLDLAANQIQTLELAVPRAVRDFDESVLEVVLQTCAPGVLNRLIITDSGSYTPKFIDAFPEPGGVRPNSFFFLIPRERFEGLLLPVAVLRLDGIYPLWSSQAYQGLVELRLNCTSRPEISITRVELYNVLTDSPQLRILEFGLKITDSFIESVLIAGKTIRLEELRVMSLDLLDSDQLRLFLGMLDPGPAPLHLTIGCHEYISMSRLGDEVTKFLRRSNITRLCMAAPHQYSLVDELLSILPRLRILAFNKVNIPQIHGLPPIPQQHNIPPISPRLDTLYVVESRLDLHTLLYLMNKHPVQTLVLWKSYMTSRDMPTCHDGVLIELSRVCSNVNNLYCSPNPIEDWDLDQPSTSLNGHT